jgi:hypothetical protein
LCGHVWPEGSKDSKSQPVLLIRVREVPGCASPYKCGLYSGC